MEIAITGTSGLIGKHLINYLCDKSHNVFGFGQNTFRSINKNNFFYFQNDLQDNLKMKQLLSSKKIDYFIHLAAIQSKECENDPFSCFEFNVVKTLEIAKICIKNKVKNFVFPSTIHVYSECKPENNVIIPSINNSNYQNSKIIIEYLFSSLSKQSETNFQILRLSNLIASKENHQQNIPSLLFVNEICNQAIKNKCIILNSSPNTKRDFITIKYFLDELNIIINSKNDSYSCIDINSNIQISIYQIALIVKEEAEKMIQKKINIIFKNKEKFNYGNLISESNENYSQIEEIKKEIKLILSSI